MTNFKETTKRITAMLMALMMMTLGGWPMAAWAGNLNLSNVPLFQGSSVKPNVLVILDNSNSMDEAADGSAVGSASLTSKSEIARKVIRSKNITRAVNPDASSDPAGLIDRYMGQINMGLMTYQQGNMSPWQIHNSPYDASFNPANYNPAFTGPRNSLTKKHRTPNLSNPGTFVYYNIALPFYAPANYGSAYCYSPTANFDNGSETYPAGPWDNYTCYHAMLGTTDNSAGLSNVWFGGPFSPTDSDLAQNVLDFGRFLTWDHVGPTWFSNSSPGRGYLHVPITALDAAQAGKLNKKLAPSQFVTNKPKDPAYPIQNAGLTPIEGTLLTAKDYFDGSLNNTNEGGPQPAPPNSCDKNFVTLLTDGLPSTNKNGSVVTNPVTAISDAANAATTLLNSSRKVKTYVVGFSLPAGANPNTLNTIAAAGGTSTAYLATNTATLQSTFDTIFTDILHQVGAGASVAVNTGSIQTNSKLFLARFNSTDWSGNLVAFAINPDGSLAAHLDLNGLQVPNGPPGWESASQIPTANNRIIVTYDGAAGVPFRWGNISGSQKNVLDAANAANASSPILNWLRGDQSNEVSNSGTLRNRSTVLGDIIHSSPLFVGAPNGAYPDNWGTGAPETAYSTFRNTHVNRQERVYVGANDGMLHAFDVATGVETFDYVPGSVYSRLASLTSPAYTHTYTVDGSPTVVDAFFGGTWHTVLVGGLNSGGQGMYALDITDPAATSEAAVAANKVLWEFTDANDADLGYTFSKPSIIRMHNGKWAAVFGNGYNNMVDNGNDGATGDSTTGDAVLYIVDIETGALIKKFDTGQGLAQSTTTPQYPNGLSTPAAVDIDNDSITDYIFAGDLQGNVWKFDVTASNPNSWDVAYHQGATPAPLFTATDANGAKQPITERVDVGTHPSQPGLMVYFGTGKYLELSDNTTTGQPTQTFYAIWDKGTTPVVGFNRNHLLQQQILQEVTQPLPALKARAVSNTSIFWHTGSGLPTGNPATTQLGWYLDLINTDPATAPLQNYGERSISHPTLRQGRIIFTTFLPPTNQCSASSDSWTMELDASNGGRLGGSALDVNGDGSVDNNDYIQVNFDTNGDGVVDSKDKIAASGVKHQGSEGAVKIATLQNGQQVKYLSGTNGNVVVVHEAPPPSTQGRKSWIRLQ